jgi:RNA polymerase sigma factor (sigma-70 family)
VLRDLLNRFYPRLLCHVRDQLERDASAGEFPINAIDAAAVTDEAVRQALASPSDKPASATYRMWLYSLAKRELRRRYRQLRRQARQTVPLDQAGAPPERIDRSGVDPIRPREVVEEQFDPLLASVAEWMPDGQHLAPDETAVEADLIDYLRRRSVRWPPRERNVFELHFVEGFEPDEIAIVENIRVSDAREIVQGIQDRLRLIVREAAELRSPSVSLEAGQIGVATANGPG